MVSFKCDFHAQCAINLQVTKNNIISSKRNINKAQWTKFWGSLHIYAAKKPARFLRRYKYMQDFQKLQKVGVDESKIGEVKTAFQNYQAPEIQFTSRIGCYSF